MLTIHGRVDLRRGCRRHFCCYERPVLHPFHSAVHGYSHLELGGPDSLDCRLRRFCQRESMSILRVPGEP